MEWNCVESVKNHLCKFKRTIKCYWGKKNIFGTILKKHVLKRWIQMEWWKERKPLWRNREINHGETDGGGCGCVCVCVTVIGDGGLEWDTFIGWLTEDPVQRQTLQETRRWNSQIIYNGSFENWVLFLLSEFHKLAPENWNNQVHAGGPAPLGSNKSGSTPLLFCFPGFFFNPIKNCAFGFMASGWILQHLR